MSSLVPNKKTYALVQDKRNDNAWIFEIDNKSDNPVERGNQQCIFTGTLQHCSGYFSCLQHHCHERVVVYNVNITSKDRVWASDIKNMKWEWFSG